MDIKNTKFKTVPFATRWAAKSIDLFLIVVFSFLLPYPVGAFAGLLYTLFQDGLFAGQSIGKKIFKIQVIYLDKNEQPTQRGTFRESAIRNSPFGVAVFFGIIPFWGWIILVLLGIPLLLLEFYLLYKMEKGRRLGDIMADTEVVYYQS